MQTPAQTQERKSSGEEAGYEKKEKDCLVWIATDPDEVSKEKCRIGAFIKIE